MDIFPVDWSDIEHESSYEIRCYGKLEDGRSACVRITFYPFFYVACPPDWSESRAKIFVAECATKHGALMKYSMPLSRKTLWGFTNSEPRPFVQLAFATVAAAKRAKTILKHMKMQTYEADVDNIIRLFHVRNIAPSSWIRVTDPCPIPVDEDPVSIADVEVTVPFTSLSPSPLDSIPPLIFASWDIECYSPTGAFPLAHKQDDAIIAICTTFQKYGAAEPFLKHGVALGTCSPVNGVELVPCETETDVLNAWIEVLKEQKADVLVGWNTFGFDYEYFFGRTLICVDDTTGHPMVNVENLGRAYEGGGVPVTKKLNSSAYGDNNYFFLSAPGILHLDLMTLIKKEHKLDSYALNAVSEKFLGDRKLDLKPAEIFAKYRGNADDRALIIEYCCKDTVLPLQLMNKLSIFQNMLEMSNATVVPMEFLITRGQQIKVLSLILKKSRSLGFVCPDFPRPSTDEEKYEGATVLDAQTGAYLEDVVSALDFASLYPSIMRAHNMCPSTLVLDARYANIPGVEYFVVETPQGPYTFAQGVQSVVPALLDDLAMFRKEAKRKMAEATAAGNIFQAAVENGRQLAFKISMNSAYGFWGATKGFFGGRGIPLAASVTTRGREMIALTKKLVEELVPGSRVVYGDTDSVMCIFNTGPGNRTNMAAHFEVAQRVADQITQTFQKPNQLEFEKTYFPYLLYSKKRYAGMLYSSSTERPDYMDVKGLQLVRRDSAPIARKVSAEILETIMRDKSLPPTVAVAKRHLLNVLRNQAPLEDYVVSQALKGNYKAPDSMPHVQVAKKILQRRGYPVPSGERVPFVFIEDDSKVDGLKAQRAEDPVYCAEHNLPLDRLHYLDSQLSGPMETLLDILAPGTFASLLASEEIQPLVAELRARKDAALKILKRQRTNTVNKQREITLFCVKQSQPSNP